MIIYEDDEVYARGRILENLNSNKLVVCIGTLCSNLVVDNFQFYCLTQGSLT